MKILFPRKQLVEKVSFDLNESANKTDDLVISSVTDSGKDFIEVDNILLVRDPKKIDDQINNMLNEDESIEGTSTTENYRPVYLEPIEKIDTTNLTLAERLKIAAKRRMMNKMAKLELTMQRELFKREDTQSNKGEKSDETEGNTLSAGLNKVLTEAAAEAMVLSETEAPKFENNENGSDLDTVIAQMQQETEDDAQSTSSEALVPEKIQSTEGPKQKELISAALNIENEKENRDVEELNLGATLSSNSNIIQESVTESVKPNEDTSEQLSLTIETENVNRPNGNEAVLGSSLPAKKDEDEMISEVVEEAKTNELGVTQIEESNQAGAKNESKTSLFCVLHIKLNVLFIYFCDLKVSLL